MKTTKMKKSGEKTPAAPKPKNGCRMVPAHPGVCVGGVEYAADSKPLPVVAEPSAAAALSSKRGTSRMMAVTSPANVTQPLDNSNVEYLPRLLEADLAAGGAQVHIEVDQDDIARRGLRLVSTAEAARLLDVGASYITALKKAAGIKGGKVRVPALLEFLRDNPGFTTRWVPVTDDPEPPTPATAALVRELRDSRPDRRYAASGKSGGLSR